MHSRWHAHTHTRARACARAHPYTPTQTTNTSTHSHKHHAHTHTHTRTHAHARTSTHSHTRTQVLQPQRGLGGSPLRPPAKLAKLGSLPRLLRTPQAKAHPSAAQERILQTIAQPSPLPDRDFGPKTEALKTITAARSELCDREGSVFYYEVYFALLHHVMYVEIPPVEHAKIEDQRSEQLQRTFHASSSRIPSVSASAVETLAAVKLQALARAHRTRKIARTKAAAGAAASASPDSPR